LGQYNWPDDEFNSLNNKRALRTPLSPPVTDQNFPRARALGHHTSPVNRAAFRQSGVWNDLAAQSLSRAFLGKVMTKVQLASSGPSPRRLAVDDHRALTLLRRLVVEIEDAIAQSREVILSTRDAIELLELLEGRRFSN
jgi:hypothetical protein